MKKKGFASHNDFIEIYVPAYPRSNCILIGGEEFVAHDMYHYIGNSRMCASIQEIHLIFLYSSFVPLMAKIFIELGMRKCIGPVTLIAHTSICEKTSIDSIKVTQSQTI